MLRLRCPSIRQLWRHEEIERGGKGQKGEEGSEEEEDRWEERALKTEKEKREMGLEDGTEKQSCQTECGAKR